MEFQLTDAQLARVMELHNAYAPACDEMCRTIDAKNAEIQRLLAATNIITRRSNRRSPKLLKSRAECETAML